mmetsp:Transcript_26503/g.57623  ORF Transcript_26503/g.57623 Transcript_26503/m.57623 type:complete len:220 (+) Transcript_26503:2260-2919(+)
MIFVPALKVTGMSASTMVRRLGGSSMRKMGTLATSSSFRCCTRSACSTFTRLYTFRCSVHSVAVCSTRTVALRAESYMSARSPKRVPGPFSLTRFALPFLSVKYTAQCPHSTTNRWLESVSPCVITSTPGSSVRISIVSISWSTTSGSMSSNSMHPLNALRMRLRVARLLGKLGMRSLELLLASKREPCMPGRFGRHVGDSGLLLKLPFRLPLKLPLKL